MLFSKLAFLKVLPYDAFIVQVYRCCPRNLYLFGNCTSSVRCTSSAVYLGALHSTLYDIACLTEQCNNKRRLQRIIRRGICVSILDSDRYVERSVVLLDCSCNCVILDNTARDELGACAH